MGTYVTNLGSHFCVKREIIESQLTSDGIRLYNELEHDRNAIAEDTHSIPTYQNWIVAMGFDTFDRPNTQKNDDYMEITYRGQKWTGGIEDILRHLSPYAKHQSYMKFEIRGETFKFLVWNDRLYEVGVDDSVPQTLPRKEVCDELSISDELELSEFASDTFPSGSSYTTDIITIKPTLSESKTRAAVTDAFSELYEFGFEPAHWVFERNEFWFTRTQPQEHRTD